MQEIQSCPVCSKESFKEYLKVPDHFGSKEGFTLVKCCSCQTLSTTPQPDEKEIITYYKSNSYVSHGDSINPIFDFVYRTIQNRNLKYKRKLIERYTLGKNLLDYGCGSGTFLEYMNKQGWETKGIEPDENARQIAEEKGVKLTSLDQLNSEYDCITLFHVLEHVHKLKETIQTLIEHLSKNGVLMLALPNYNSRDAQQYREFWAGYDVPRHLYHFNQKSIFSLAKEFGLNIVSTHPLYFDSYYVSLLSEKYKNGKGNLIGAVKTGYLSNHSAKKTKEHSSLIYVLSK
ncbi:MAG: class I SAM-dependent methyltransferase [Cytophagia bacterium]|nr:class I SAM-dependent methyltransferase [Cytophagia bacterium]